MASTSSNTHKLAKACVLVQVALRTPTTAQFAAADVIVDWAACAAGETLAFYIGLYNFPNLMLLLVDLSYIAGRPVAARAGVPVQPGRHVLLELQPEVPQPHGTAGAHVPFECIYDEPQSRLTAQQPR